MSKQDSANAEERIAQILKDAQNAMVHKSHETSLHNNRHHTNHISNNHTSNVNNNNVCKNAFFL